MPPVGFELKISGGERPQTYALDREATGSGICFIIHFIFLCCPVRLKTERNHSSKNTVFRRLLTHDEAQINNLNKYRVRQKNLAFLSHVILITVRFFCGILFNIRFSHSRGTG
jgi:hypothetical protein